MKEPDDIIELPGGRKLIQLKSDFKKQSKEAQKLLLDEMRRFNEAVLDLLIKAGER